MSDTLHIPPFKTEDGLHIAELPNGGWLVRSPDTGMMMPKLLAAFSTPDELITALARAIGSPTEVTDHG